LPKHGHWEKLYWQGITSEKTFQLVFSFVDPVMEKDFNNIKNILKVEIDFPCNVLGQFSILYFEEQPHIMMKQKA